MAFIKTVPFQQGMYFKIPARYLNAIVSNLAVT